VSVSHARYAHDAALAQASCKTVVLSAAQKRPPFDLPGWFDILRLLDEGRSESSLWVGFVDVPR
jgi:hypothetical protein